MMLCRLEKLLYVEDGETVWNGVLHLNQMGRTVAQAEFDRRFDLNIIVFPPLHPFAQSVDQLCNKKIVSVSAHGR